MLCVLFVDLNAFETFFETLKPTQPPAISKMGDEYWQKGGEAGE